MFRKYLISLICLWALIAGGGIWFLMNSSSQAKVTYWQLMNECSLAKKETEPKQKVKQLRTAVSKQILYKQDDQRLQTRLKSIESELHFEQMEQGVEFLEYFKSLECIQQEKLFYLMDHEIPQASQGIRYINAEEAIYSYKTGLFVAQNVKLSRHRLPGDVWPASFDFSTPYFHGQAKQVEFSLFQKPVFRAEGLQAIFSDWGK